MLPKDECELVLGASSTASDPVIESVFLNFLIPTISKLKELYPESSQFSVSIYIRSMQFTTFPKTIIGTAPYCTNDLECTSDFWSKVVDDAQSYGFIGEKIPSSDHPYHFNFKKIS